MSLRIRSLGPCAVVVICAVTFSAPASAAPAFLERYGNLFAARPALTAPGDSRPQDALQAQENRVETPASRLVLSPFVRDDDRTGFFGGGAAYANVSNPRHPWSVDFIYSRLGIDGSGEDFDTLSASGRFVLWQPADPRLPVVSVVGSYFDPDDLGRRWDVLLAADQRVSDQLFATVNLGYGRSNFRLGEWESDFIPAFGLTYSPCPRFSLAADYGVDNNLDTRDTWSLSAIWAFDRTSSLRIGGGKDGLVFANYFAKWDWD